MSRHAWMLSTALLLSAAFAPLTAARVDLPDRGLYRHSDLRAVAEDAERLSDSFRKKLDRELDRTIIDGTKREKQVERNAEKLENALDEVRSAIRNGKRFNVARKRVKRSLRFAQRLDRDLVRLRLSPGLIAHWRQLQARLDELAFYHELRHTVR